MFWLSSEKKVQALIIILIMVMKNENVLDYWYGKIRKRLPKNNYVLVII